MRKWTIHILLFAISLPCFSQGELNSLPDSSQKINYTSRKWLVGSASAIGYAGTMYILNNAWYKDYPRSSFHIYNDAGEWNQMDKVGHAWSTYTASRVVSEMWKWAGVSRKNSVWLGTGTSMVFMTSIEYLDGLSEEWGWSWADMGMNLFGAGLYAVQEFGWKEQKIQLKFSTHYINYEEPDLEQRANDLFGSSWPERMLKDYNAQTYWLSANIASITKSKKIPSWLNLAFGYGAGGMFGGYENVAYDKDGNVTFDRRDIERYRQFYLAPDIDFTRIKTKSKFLKATFFVLNAFKMPAPALEFSKGKFYVKAIVF